jgi:hypothetical protein
MKRYPWFVGAFAALSAAALLFSSAAQARVFEGGVTHEDLRKLLIEAGLQAVSVEPDASDANAVPELVVMGGPARWHVQFMSCSEGRCGDLRFSVGYDLNTKVDAPVVNELNESMLGWISGNVYIDEEGDPILQADVNTDGATGSNIKYSAKVFDAMMRCTSVKIGFDDTADACTNLQGLFYGFRDQSVAADDASHVVFALTVDDLTRILRNSGFDLSAGSANSGMVSLRVGKDGVIWTAAIPEATADQINGALILITVCRTCDRDGARRAHAYNAARRWLTAVRHDDNIVVGTMILPLSGGVAEASIGMMIRSFHDWAVKFDRDMPK